ncbi:adenylate/guanylate cyclase domain-containing protein [Gaiella sp.]|uniref:ATP-binding protein n=1 Tax=Gaiella sp. TaxID=2663207 RepID=UPI0032653DB3
MAFCPNCGQPVPTGARFCSSCASPISQPARSSEERKLATVLFADLVGSTELASSQDPERTRSLLNRFYDAMAAEIADAGGTVEKFVGDAVMAAFGAPAAQEDHAERALHAALSMQRRLEEMFGGALSLRIGVNTGDVVVGQPREGSSFVTGDAVNVAARLEQAAEPGEILVGKRTAAAVGGAFELGEPSTVAAKGKAGGVACRRLIRALSLMRPRGVGGLHHSFVGREPELEALQDAYGRAVEGRKPRLVTIMGDAGIGKTALIREFWEWLNSQSPEPRRRTGRCPSYGRGITLMPLGEIVREHFGLLESDAPDTVRRRLGDRAILGLTLGLEAPTDLHPLAARDRLRQAWVAFLEELVAEQPAVVLVEDLHWADEALLDLLEAGLHDVRGPMLLLATARPELVHSRPQWGGGARGRDGDTLWLEALSPSDTARMIDELIPAALPVPVRAVVVERAEGNPFFVEELVQTLIDQGVLERRDGSWTAHELADDFVVPDTVQAVLAARIDLLAPADKAGLQAAAVIGRTFWSGPVYELLDDLEPDLRLLEERDFIRHRSGSSLAGEREFVIKHALTREVAYGTLPTAKRARLHARFATWLERVGEGRDEHAALLAHHYAEAVRPKDVDLAWPGDDEELGRLRTRAVTWLRRASDLAVGRYEIEDAVSLLKRAIELETSPTAQVEIWAEIGHANVLYFDGEAFSSAMQRAIELADDDLTTADLYSELAFQTLVRWGMWGVAPEADLVEGWIRRALELARPGSAARAKALIARCYSDDDKSPELASEASGIAEQLGDPAVRSYGYDVRGLSAFAAGNYAEATEWNRRRLSLVDEIQDPDHQADIYLMAVAPAVAGGHFDEARRYTVSHAEVTHRLSPHHRLHGVSAILELEELLGDWNAASGLQQRVEDAVAANVATPCVRNQRSLLVCALARAYLGDDEEARRLERGAEAYAMTGHGTVLYTPRVQLALHRDDLAAVELLVREPRVRRSSWRLSSMATHLDGLAALGDRKRVEDEASRLLQPNTYLEPFALRALGLVREDASLIERAADRFEAFGLNWHAAQTRTRL